jgi:hypothetical protein
MPVDTKDIQDVPEQLAEAAVEGAVMGADLVTGTAATLADAVSEPGKTARAMERRGARINRAMAKAVGEEAEDAVEALETMPERVLMAGIKMLKAGARRRDVVGSVSFRLLEIANDRVEDLAGLFRRIERATEPPARQASIRRPARSAARGARRTTRRAARTTASAASRTARRGTARARRTERK